MGRMVISKAAFGIFISASLILCGGVWAEELPVYEFDKSHTTIRFTYDHLGLTRQDGQFLDFSGKLVFDELAVDESSVEVVIKTASLRTNVEALDKKLRGEEYFNAQKYPEIRFKSKSVKQTGAKRGQVTGDLSINGKTKTVTLDITFNFAGKHPLASFLPDLKGVEVAAFSANTRILRSDFGMSKYTPMVSDEVEIEIEAELRKVK